jgi:hypothetical protein
MTRVVVRLAILATLSFLAGSLTGCGPRWSVITQAAADPLRGAKVMYIEPIHYDPPIVGAKSEGEYLADKSADQRDGWLTDKADTSNRFIATLISSLTEVQFATQPAPGVFIVRPIVSFIEPGFIAPFASAPTQVRMRVQVLSSDGAIIDDIAIPSAIPASLMYPASGTRMRLAGEDLGRVTAEYLRKRILPAS